MYIYIYTYTCTHTIYLMFFHFFYISVGACHIHLLQIFQLEEKDTQTKLETLFKKNMYDMAIK